MRLVLDLPEGFPPAGLTVEVAALRSRPYDVAGWVTRAIERGRPKDQVRILGQRRTTTALGWPLDVVEVAFVDPDRPRLELVALYHFGHHVASAAMIGVSLPANALEVLASGRPDWSGPDIVALAQLWAPGTTKG